MLEAVEVELCLLKVLEVLEVMRCVLGTLYWRLWGWAQFVEGAVGIESDAPYATVCSW